MRVGDKFTLTPSVDGQTGSTGWKWDNEYFSATFNSPATFTALKAGTSTITYAAPDGRVASVTVTVLAAEGAGGTGGDSVKPTGDAARLDLFAALAALAATSLCGVSVWRRRRRKA